MTQDRDRATGSDEQPTPSTRGEAEDERTRQLSDLASQIHIKAGELTELIQTLRVEIRGGH